MKFDKICKYCISEIRKNSIGVAVVIFAVTTFLILFLIIKPYFFPHFLETKFETEEERGRYVLERLIR